MNINKLTGGDTVLHQPPLDMDNTESTCVVTSCKQDTRMESVYPGSVMLQAAGGGAGVFIHVYMFTTLSGQRAV